MVKQIIITCSICGKVFFLNELEDLVFHFKVRNHRVFQLEEIRFNLEKGVIGRSHG